MLIVMHTGILGDVLKDAVGTSLNEKNLGAVEDLLNPLLTTLWTDFKENWILCYFKAQWHK